MTHCVSSTGLAAIMPKFSGSGFFGFVEKAFDRIWDNCDSGNYFESQNSVSVPVFNVNKLDSHRYYNDLSGEDSFVKPELALKHTELVGEIVLKICTKCTSARHNFLYADLEIEQSLDESYQVSINFNHGGI